MQSTRLLLDGDGKLLLDHVKQRALARRVQHALLDRAVVSGARVNEHIRHQLVALVAVLVREQMVAR